MNFKSFTKGLVAGVMSLAFAGSAFAAPGMPDINLYGASAQFTFWRQMSSIFLLAKNCTNVECSQATNADFIARGFCGTDTNPATGYTYFRVSSKASWEGPCSVTGSTNPNCYTTCDPTGVNKKMRNLANENASGTVWSACQTVPPISYTNSGAANKCVEINVGASDVYAKNFNESSDGCINGPNNVTGANACDQATGPGGTGWIHRAFTPTGINTAGYFDCKPFAVPFAVYANNSILMNGSPLQNLPRLKVVLIFSGQVTKWTDFGSQYTLAATGFNGQPCDQVNNPIVACFRHAGSGTAAAFDHVIMHANWGAPVLTYENPVVFNGNQITTNGAYFNEGTGAMMDCVNGGNFASQGYDANYNFATATQWSGCGAVGYADADWLALNQAGTCATNPNGKGCNTRQLYYQGEPTFGTVRQHVRNGDYIYWTGQHLYMPANTPAHLLNLCTWANNRANIDAAGAEANFWATQCEMKVNRADDKDYPSVSAASPTCSRIGD